MTEKVFQIKLFHILIMVFFRNTFLKVFVFSESVVYGGTQNNNSNSFSSFLFFSPWLQTDVLKLT